MKVNIEKDSCFDGYNIYLDEEFKGVIIMIDGGYVFDSDGEELSLHMLRQVVKFMESL